MNLHNLFIGEGTVLTDAARVPVVSKEDRDQQAVFTLVWQQETTAGTADHLFVCVVCGLKDAEEAVRKLKQFTAVSVVGELRARDGAATKIRVTSYSVK